MGAIAGVIYPDPFHVGQLTASMLPILAHRANGEPLTYTYRNAQIGGFSHSFGSDQQKTIWVAHDTQISNQTALREELKKAGYLFPENNSTELIASAYRQWGKEFIQHIEGDFAIALLDQEKEELHLFRDRIGKKPLYWVHEGGQFLFASELKALLTTRVIPQTPAVDALAHYLFLGYIPQDMSPILTVNKLLPGYTLCMKLSGHKRISSYWSCSSFFAQQREVKAEDFKENLNFLLKKSIDSQRDLNKKLGCFLGGGLGSATVASYLVDSPSTAFSAVFKGETTDDLQAAEQVARSLKMPHEHHSVSLERLFKELVQVVWHLDEPLADPNILLTWQQAKMAKASGVGQIFSGMGADELLGCHMRYHTEGTYSSFSRWITSLPLPLVKGLAIPLVRLASPSQANRLLRHLLTNPAAIAFLKEHAIFQERQIRQLAPGLSRFFDVDVFIQKFYQMARIKEAISSTQYIDTKTRLPDLFVHQVERLTAAHGLCWETPFLATPIVEYTAGINPDFKGLGDPVAIPLQSLMKGILPATVTKQLKKNRRNLLSQWIENPLVQETIALLEKGTLVDSGLILPKAIKKLSLEGGGFQKLFSLLTLEIWFRLYINNPIGERAPKVWVSELLRSRT